MTAHTDAAQEQNTADDTVIMFQPRYVDYDDVRFGPVFADHDSAASWVEATNAASRSEGSYYVENWSVEIVFEAEGGTDPEALLVLNDRAAEEKLAELRQPDVFDETAIPPYPRSEVSTMTTPPVALQRASEYPASADDYLEQRTALQEQAEAITEVLESIDGYALTRLREYEQEPLRDKKIPCAVNGTGWEVEYVGTDGITFTHDCRDHGYDLACTESFTLPGDYVRDPAAWRAQREAQDAAEQERAAAAMAQADERAKARRREQYAALRAEFGDDTEEVATP